MKADWLNRNLVTGPYLCLVLSQAEYHQAMEDLDIEPHLWGEWIKPGYNGLVQTLQSKKGDHACIVSIANWEGRDPIEVAGILIHESVHVFQSLCRIMGESYPSDEFEAYTIQVIAMRLMDSFERKVDGTPAEG